MGNRYFKYGKGRPTKEERIAAEAEAKAKAALAEEKRLQLVAEAEAAKRLRIEEEEKFTAGLVRETSLDQGKREKLRISNENFLCDTNLPMRCDFKSILEFFQAR